jgi:hypothetical protein
MQFLNNKAKIGTLLKNSNNTIDQNLENYHNKDHIHKHGFDLKSKNSTGKGNYHNKQSTKKHNKMNLLNSFKISQSSDRELKKNGNEFDQFKDTPDLNFKIGNWTETEQNIIFREFSLHLFNWVHINKFLIGRNKNSIKSYFHSAIRRIKKLKIIKFLRNMICLPTFRNNSKILFGILSRCLI